MSTTKDKPTESVEYEVFPTAAKKVRFYIPTDKDGAANVVDRVVRRLADLFGGATELPAKGAYVMDDGELCRETVALVESFAAEMDTADLTRIALDIKQSLDEEAVAFEIENTETALI